MPTDESTPTASRAETATSLGHEFRLQRRIAVPLIAGYMAEIGMWFTDAVIVGHLGGTELGAVSLSGLVFWEIVLTVSFIPSVVGVFVGNAYGRGDSTAVRRSGRRRGRVQLVRPDVGTCADVQSDGRAGRLKCGSQAVIWRYSVKAGHHIVSLSLGSVAEPSGLVVVQPRTEFSQPDEDGRRDHENFFNVSWLERFPGSRPITAIAARASELMADKRLAKNCSLLLDVTSTGAAPVRVFEGRGVYPNTFDLAATTTEGQPGNGPKRVPLRDVVGSAQVVLQTNRLKVASELELAETLVTDLTAFDPKAVTRNMDLRGGRNADLVLALAAALWWGDSLTWGDWPRGDRPANLVEHGWMAV